MAQHMNRQQAITKLNQFHQKLSKHIVNLVIKKQQKQKQYKYVIYQPTKIDTYTQTITDKSIMNKIFKSKPKIQESNQKRIQRTNQLKSIVEDNFKNYFKTAKTRQNELETQLNQLKFINQQLQSQCLKKDNQIGVLKLSLNKNCQLLQSVPKQSLQIQRVRWQKQHQIDIKAINNLQKGICQFQKQIKHVSSILNEKQSQLFTKSKRIKQIQVLYKKSQNLLDAMSRQEQLMSQKINKLDNELRIKNSYIEYVQNMYIGSQKQNIKLKKQIQYYSYELQVLKQRIKQNKQDEYENNNLIQYYKKCIDFMINKQKLQTQKCQYVKLICNNENNDKFKQGLIYNDELNYYNQLIQKYNQQYINQSFNYTLNIQTQSQIIQQYNHIYNYIAQQQSFIQTLISNLQQFYLIQAEQNIQFQSFKLYQTTSNIYKQQLYQSQNEKQNSSSESQSEKLISQTNNASKQYFSETKIQTHQEPSPLENTPILAITQCQQYHKQNQLSIKHIQTQITPFQQDNNSHHSQSLIPSPNNLNRPPSFGKDTDDQIHSESDRETPNFTEISLSESHQPSDIPQNHCHLIQSDPSKCDQQRNEEFVTRIKRTQTFQDTLSQDIPNVKMSKSQKVYNIVTPINEKKSEQKINCQNFVIQKKQSKKLLKQNSQSDLKPPQSKQAYCQATKDQNGLQINDKQKQGVKFIKKHENMTNYNGTQQLSPSYQKQQSDCHLMVDKNKKNPKKKIQFKLPEGKTKANLIQLQKQVIHNIQTHNLLYRRLQKQKAHKITTCPKLSQRLSQLIHKQSTIQLHLSIIQQQNNYQSLGSLGSPSSKQPELLTTHVVVNQEIQIISEMEKLIHDTYEWILLIDRLNKKEFQKHDRLISRIKLKKTKTGINHHKIKQKQSNEDCYQTNTLFECEKQKSVYSEGDSPRGIGQTDHFDISPFDHIQVQQKHQDMHSLEKLFKEGPQISEISSVKNQSQVSQFINSRSYFDKMFDPSNFGRVEEQEAHNPLAYTYHESMDINSPTPNGIGNSLQNKNNTQNVIHENANHQSLGNQVKFEDKSTKSIKNIPNKQKQKVKLLERKIIQLTSQYKGIVDKLVEQDKKKTLKMQKDFNKAMSMAINLKQPASNNFTLSLPSSLKQGEISHIATSIKLLPSSQPKHPIPQVKSPTSKLQSKSLTEITLLSQKINQKDQILEEKMQAYEKKIEQLTKVNDEMKVKLNAKLQQIQELQKKTKHEKMQVQKIQKKFEELKKQVQQLKTQKKKIKNQFSQFMSKLVIEQKKSRPAIKFSKKASYDDNAKVTSSNVDLQCVQNMTQKQNAKQIILVKSQEKIEIKSQDRKLFAMFQSGQNKMKVSLLQHQLKNNQPEQKQSIKQIPVQITSITDAKIQQQKESIDSAATSAQSIINTNKKLQLQLQSKDQQIKALSIQIQQNKITIQQLKQDVTKLKQSNNQLNEQIDFATMQLSQKQGEISQLGNTLKSIQIYERKLKLKLNQAEDKIKDHEHKKIQDKNKLLSTPSKKLISNQQQHITPISQLKNNSNNQNKQISQVQNRQIKRRGSLGSMDQNFFDLQNQNEFNNIESKTDLDKDIVIKNLEKQLSQTKRKLEQQTKTKTKQKRHVIIKE